MKLSDYKDEAALDLLADLIEPATEILADAEVRKAAEDGSRLRAVALAIKNHKRAVMSVLATFDGVPATEYHCNVLTLPAKLIELFDDPDIAQLFTFAGQTEEQTPSGSPTENTEDVAQ
ncbi:MAG: hypothetical protein IJG87_06460 [Ruminococcus sp.]|nr:hypothetical protein [Ruminococcus sp.]